MIVEGQFTIDCNRCGKSYDFTSKDVFFTKVENHPDTYVWEKKYNCVKCGNPISIHYEVTLADDGTLIDKNLQVDGAKMVKDTFGFKM